MNKRIQGAILELYEMEAESRRNHALNLLHPLVKLIVTVFYIIMVVSLHKYDLSRLLLYGIYPIVIFILGDLSFQKLLKRMKLLIGVLFFLGIANPFFDRQILFSFGNIEISAGMISMLTLWIKGVFALTASYLLMVTTPINGICQAMRSLHIPKIFVTVVLLIYRYIFVLLEEADHMMQAYSLRAPEQKGIHYKVWGSMIGMMLLRSVDFSEMVYQSMILRGYQGEFFDTKAGKIRWSEIVYLIVWILVFIILRRIG